MKKALACTMFLGVVFSQPAAADELRFKGGIGVHPVSAGVAVAPTAATAAVVESVSRNIVRGVQPAGQIWVIDKLDAIIREQVKPLENIEGIKILHVEGLGGGGGGSGGGDFAGAGGFSDQVVNSALRYRAQAPLVDELLKEIGIDTGKAGQTMATGLLKAATKTPKPEGSGS